MADCNPTRMLRDEHRRILRVLDGLESVLGEGQGVGPERLADFVAFFRLFTDACHHGKEEDLLFGALEERGFSRQEGPVAVMLYEHAQGRALVRRMEAALEAMEADASSGWAAFEDAAGTYIALLRAHITKEDHVLFDMADMAVPEPDCRRLCEAYDAVCARRFEGRSLADLEALADRLAGEVGKR